jgi:hypothetical protein
VTHRVSLAFAPRVAPLAPRGVVGFDEVAKALARRLLALPDEALAALAGVHGDGTLVVLGEEEALPFVDGVVYVGREDGVASVLLSTTEAPNVAVRWLDALLREHDVTLPAVVLLHAGSLHVLPVADARPVTRAHLTELLRGGPA